MILILFREGFELDQPLSFYQRRKKLLEHGVEFTEHYYDDHCDLVWDKQYLRHRVRESAWLAQCYLQLGIMPSRANALLKSVLKTQSLEGEHAGNFRWNFEDETITDQNCAPFIVPSLAYIMRHHWEQLDSDVRRQLPIALDRANSELIALEKHIPIWYGNIYLQIIAGLVMTGDEEQAYQWTLRYYDFTCNFGINEYAAWNYSVVQIGALQNAYWYAQDEKLKRLLADLLEFHWFDIVHQIHVPTLMLSSPASRARGRTGLTHNDTILTFYYLYFGLGEPRLDGLPRVELFLSDYQPSSRIQGIVADKMKGHPFSYQARYNRVDIVSYQNSEFALATQTGRRSSLGITNTTKPLLSSEKQEISIQINVKNQSLILGTAFRVNDARGDFDRFWISSVQSRGLAVISYNFTPEGCPVSEISSSAILGSSETIAKMIINGVVWTGNKLAIDSNAVIAYQIGSSFIGIRFLESDVIKINHHLTATVQQPIVISETNGDVELKNYLFYDQATHKISELNKRLGYLVYIQEKESSSTLADFYRQFASIKLYQNLKNAIHTVKVIHGTDTLKLEEDLASNTVRSRQINGKEFSNSYLLKSKYVEYMVGEALTKHRYSAIGQLNNANLPPVTKKQIISVNPATAILHEHNRSLAINIPRSGNWGVRVRVLCSNATDDEIKVWWNGDSRGFHSVVLPLIENPKPCWLSVPSSWLHQGTHILWLESNSQCEIESILITQNDIKQK